MEILTTILAFVVTLGILVVIHEFGHYWVARRCGVKVLQFSIGFGKSIASFKRKNDPDQVEWKIAAIPLGGYVRMLDERDPQCLPIKPEDKNRTFNSKNVWKRFAIVAAGPVSNLLLAIVLYAGLYMYGITLPQPIVVVTEPSAPAAVAGFQNGDKVLSVADRDVQSFSDMRLALINKIGESSVPVTVESQEGNRHERVLDLSAIKLDGDDQNQDPLDRIGLSLKIGPAVANYFVEGSVAEKAGMRIGDTILTANGKSVDDLGKFVGLIKASPNKPINITVRGNDGQTRDLIVVPEEKTDAEGNKIGRVGVSFGVDLPKVTISYNPVRSLWEGAVKTWDTTEMSVRMIWKMIVGEVSVKNLSGPVSIADYAGKTARMGLESFVSFLALISISLGILNLLPVPMLDGGHLLYYSVEIIRGKPVSERVQEVAQKVGVAILCCLTVLALFNDLTRLLS